MTQSQALITCPSMYKKVDENGLTKTFFSFGFLQIHEGKDRRDAQFSRQYVSEDVYKMYEGDGIYEIKWNVTYDFKGNPKPRISYMELYKEIDL